jgi:hypothetical protein
MNTKILEQYKNFQKKYGVKLLLVGFIVAALFAAVFYKAPVDRSGMQEHDSDRTSSQTSESKEPRNTGDLLPSTILDLKNWKLTLPIDTDDSGVAHEIEQPQLQTFRDRNYFYANDTRDGVVFRAYADGITTKNSKYPRSELREMTDNGSENANWTPSRGVHTMTVRQAITHRPDEKDELVAAQIHDTSDDVVMVRLEGNRLFVESGGKNIGDLDANYVLGTVYTVTITVKDNMVYISYNDVLKVTHAVSGTGYYFKAGCYTQTNLSRGDPATSYGEVVIYKLEVTHS